MDDPGQRPDEKQTQDFADYQIILEECKTEFSTNLREWKQRGRDYKKNKRTAYGMIWKQCSVRMQTCLKADPDFKSKIEEDPIVLLEAIKKYSVNYQENRNEIDALHDAYRNALLIKQRDDESLIEYYTRFKHVWEVLTTQQKGDLYFPSIMEREHSTQKQRLDPDNSKKQGERFRAIAFIKRADKDKYGSLQSALTNRTSLGHDEFPSDLTAAFHVLEQRRWDADWKTKKEAKGKHKKPKDTSKQRNENDEEQVPQELTFAQMEARCYCCGVKGHKSPNCPRKNKIPKEEWAVNKMQNKAVQQYMQNRRTPSSSLSVITEDGSVDNSESDDTARTPVTKGTTMSQRSQEHETSIDWMGVQLAHEQGVTFSQAKMEHMREWLLLDSQSTIDSFCNKDFVKDIRRAKTPMQLATNAGTTTLKWKADANSWGEVWFDENSMTNIFSLANMEDRYRVTYDSAVESAFVVHTEKGPIKFHRGPEGLYYLKMTPKAKQFLETITENKSFCTPREIDAAKKARNLLRSLGNPHVNDLKKIIKMNSIKDCPVTLSDIQVAERIFGPDIAGLKGKVTRRKPEVVREELVDIPPELKMWNYEVELFIDTFFVCGLPFLSTISAKLFYRTATYVTRRNIETYKDIIVAIMQVYHNNGFKVTKITSDREFKPMVDSIPNVRGNYANALEHVPVAERNNRTIQERTRCSFHSLPFRAISKLMIKYLVIEAARKLNYFPPKGGISQYYSPREIIHRVKLDYARHCAVSQYAYVQAHDEPSPSNTLAQRTLDSLYVRPSDNTQEGHVLINLTTRSIITRRKITPVPMPDHVISAVEAWAKEDGLDKLTINHKSGHIIYDSSWIAGVDYTHETLEDDVFNDSDYEDPSTEEEDSAYNPEDYESEDLEVEDQDESSQENQEDNPTLVNEREDTDDPERSQMEATDNEHKEQSDSEDEEYIPHRPATEPILTHHETSATRSGRVSRPPTRMNLLNVEYNQGQTYGQVDAPLLPKPAEVFEYTATEARVLAMIMLQLEERLDVSSMESGSQFLVTYSLKKGIEKFGEQGRASALKEMKQLHDRECFQPIRAETLNKEESKRALESLIFLVEKRDGTIKSRHCANGSLQRMWMSREDTSSPTVSTESTLLTAVIEAEEGRDVATCDIPNAFIQTAKEPRDKDGHRTIMKIRGVLVDILCEMDRSYEEYVHMEHGKKVLYVHITKAIYGLLESAMLFYRRLVKDLTAFGFEINPYDPCVANKMVNGHQMTVSWHVDDLKISHKDPRQIDGFIAWVKKTYGSIGEVKVTRGKIHDYLGMKLEYTVPGQVTIDMVDYVQSMIDNFPKAALKGPPVASPWSDNLFQVKEDSPLLAPKDKEQFHTTTAQALFLTKRARPDIGPAVAYCTTRVREPNEDDWKKIVRMMRFLNQTKKDRLTLRADGSGIMHWHVDASFAVHPDFKSHTGGTYTMGEGVITHMSRKQGLNTRSSTEAEVVAADDVIGPMLWTKLFLEWQGYPVKENILYQDNRSAMLLESNGRRSAGKRSRHLNIRYFFVTDQKEKKHISIQYCPTDEMLADYMTKPLHGEKFRKFRERIMNLSTATQLFSICFMQVERPRPGQRK